jgi:membrane fusion protein, heavy metal efflux system
MNYLLMTNLAILGVVTSLVSACSEEHKGHEGHGHEEQSHEVHDHEDHEKNRQSSDLDKPIDQLFAQSCEHKIKTYECDECRYEVGVVKADQKLFDGNLLKTAKATKTTVTVPLTLTGEVQFDERRVTHVSTQADGIIRKVHVMLGDKVKKGQALVELESVAVGDAEADYLEAGGILELARRNHDRIEALRKEAISSEKEMLMARQELGAAKIRSNAALGKLVRLGMTPAAARSLTQARSRGRLVLRAPAKGTLLEMHAVAGEVAHSESSLATIGENSSVWVWADLYEQDMAVVISEQAKQPLVANIQVKAFPDEQFHGTVDFVSPAMSALSRTVKLRIEVQNPDSRLLAGMFAGVDIFLRDDQQALTVPTCAVLEDEGRNFIFVHHKDDYYVRRPVETGRSFGDSVEITSGLEGSERLVTNGAFLLKSDVLRSKMGAGCAH